MAEEYNSRWTGEQIDAGIDKANRSVQTLNGIAPDSNGALTVVPTALGFGYATCSTSASTAAKVATLSGFTLKIGGFVSVLFSYAPTSFSTLNVNNTGAYSVQLSSSGIQANDIATFVFDGTYYRLVAVKRYVPSYYGTCSTSASTQTKTVTCAGFVRVTGARIAVKFTYTNTAGSPYLNVNGTGAYYIKRYGSTSSISYDWWPGEVVEFVFDGSYWVIVDGGYATTTYYGVTKLYDGTGSSSTTLAATANSVRLAYNRGTEAYNYADDAYVEAGNSAHRFLYTATLNTSSWTSNSNGGYMMTVTVTGILASDTPTVGIVQTGTMSTDKAMIEAWALVSRIVTSVDTITVYAYGNKPTVNIPIQLECVR